MAEGPRIPWPVARAGSRGNMGGYNAPMDILASGARSLLNLELTPAQLAAFQAYADLLLAWNEKFNLTAIRDLVGVQVKHFLDSLTVLRALPAHQGAPRV